MINKKIFFFSFCLFLFLTTFGCGRGAGNSCEEFIDLGREGLIQGADYTFFPFKSDSLNLKKGYYDFSLVIRYSDKCRIKSLPFEIQFPLMNSDSVVAKKFDVPLFDRNDENVGKGNFGLYETRMKIMEHVETDDSFYFSIMTPDPNSAGIVAVGFTATKI